ncbi:MAG: hypothetical protein GTO63_06535 [Anaerolineae bacterium]|nr:hypothetical protein [Anaerolineae bacterium]
MTGILLGVETGIPADLMADFSATGTTHIIAISGFDTSIIAGLFSSLCLLDKKGERDIIGLVQITSRSSFTNLSFRWLNSTYKSTRRK